ncbi:MAG: transposase [Methylocapsa sp.]|nr:transposase [Methylocapsa sp.]
MIPKPPAHLNPPAESIRKSESLSFPSGEALQKTASEALVKRGCEPCIPSTESQKIPLPYDKALYKQRHKIENMFAKLKDWRRIASRYDRCAHTFFSAICIAAAVGFYRNQ